jgi:hypothetical protein
MANATPIDAVPQIVTLLTPLSPEDRRRAIRAALALLGDEATNSITSAEAQGGHHDQAVNGNFPPRAQVWMKQNSVSTDEVQQVFHIADGTVEVIAPEIPGKSDKEKTYAAYILTGIAKLLETGNPSFDDKTARALCKSSGCYNSINHSTYLNDKGNEFTGSKDKGWTLTAPGLKRGAALVKELNKAEK